MSRRQKIRLFQLLLGTGLFCMALSFANLAEESLRLTQIVLDSEISAEQVQQIQQQEWKAETPVGFCFWGETPQQTLSCQETGKNVQVTQILLAGNPELMDAAPLAWQRGCLVDAQTAYALFGTTQVGGQVLWADGKSYPVLGIVDATRPTMLRMAEGEEILDRLVMAASGEKGAAEAAQCLLRWDLQGEILNPVFLWSLVQNFLLLFPGILCAMACSRLALGWREMGDLFRQKQWLRLGRIVLAGVLLGGGVWFLGSRVVIPASMIPTKWSDFSFWQNWWAEAREHIQALLLTPMDDGRLQMLWNMVKSIAANAGACLAVLWPIRERFDANSAD